MESLSQPRKSSDRSPKKTKQTKRFVVCEGRDVTFPCPIYFENMMTWTYVFGLKVPDLVLISCTILGRSSELIVVSTAFGDPDETFPLTRPSRVNANQSQQRVIHQTESSRMRMIHIEIRRIKRGWVENHWR
jgi:hypothetical protein